MIKDPVIQYYQEMFHVCNSTGPFTMKTETKGKRLAIRDVTYPSAYPNNTMDIYLADRRDDQKRTTLFFIHGGGFTWGDKNSAGDNCTYEWYFDGFLKTGCNVVSVNYAFAPEYTYPTPVLEIRDAVKFLINKGEKFGISMEQIIFAGTSAGGQIAGQLVNIETNAEYAEEMELEQILKKEQIKAVIFNSALLQMEDFGNVDTRETGELFLKCGMAYYGVRTWESSGLIRQANVIDHITSDFPPCFISDANRDSFKSQAEKLDRKLTELGIYHVLNIYPEQLAVTEHGYECLRSESAERNMLEMEKFLLRVAPETTVKELLSIPVLSDIRDLITYGKAESVLKEMGNSPLKDLVPPVGNIVSDMADSYNELISMKLEGRAESCGHGLLFLKGEPGAPFAVICPGGGYLAVCSYIEGIPVAARLSRKGINAFVLQYTTGVPGTAEKARRDLVDAVRYILENRESLQVSERYAIFGFSAGGHLAAEAGTDNLGLAGEGLSSPDALILGYPVLDPEKCDENTKKLLLDVMLHPGWTEEEMDRYRILSHVDSEYPAVYIWQAEDDDTVWFDDNCLALYQALLEKKVRVMMRRVHHGGHGIGAGSGTEAEGWLDEAVDFWLD